MPRRVDRVPLMRVLETAVYIGPHLSSRVPMVRIRLAIDELEAWPTDRLGDFGDRLVALIPSLQAHRCSRGQAGGFVERLREGTWIGHVVEHVALELQCLAGSPAGRGKTRGVRGEPGVYDLMYAYEEAPLGLAAGALALRIVDDLLPDKLRGLDLGALPAPIIGPAPETVPGLAELRECAARVLLGPTTRSLANAARRRGIPVYRVPGTSVLRLGYGSRQRTLRASITDRTSHLAVALAADKHRTRAALSAAGLPVAKGILVRSADEAAAAAMRLGGPVVIKPLDGNHGRGVAIGLVTPDEIRLAFEAAAHHSRSVLVEALVRGRDYRALVVAGCVVALAERASARVVGDDLHTVAELVEAINADPLRGAGHSAILTRIAFDDEVDRILESQDLSRDSVPAAGREVILRRTANLSTGGEAIDRTDAIHPDNIALLERAARVIGLDVTGIDLITPDIGAPIMSSGGAIIEVNAAPGFRMHLHPSEGRPRDVAAPVIDAMIAHSDEVRIPVVAVTGTNGKTTTVRMIAHVLSRQGLRVGMTTTSGIDIDGRRVRDVDASGPRSARLVLDDPTVDAAVLETARGGILRAGLAVGDLDVGVVMNVASDHLGTRGVATLNDLARAKSVVTKSVRRTGLSVLNADDRRTLAMASTAGGRLGLFTLHPLTAKLHAHLASGALIAALESVEGRAWLVLYDGAERLPIIASDEIPATIGGAAAFNVYNALAAALAAHHVGVAAGTIAEALRTFDSSYEQNPGRLNLTRAPGFTTIVDYAHNPAALRALGDLLRELRPHHARLIGVVSTPGDRRDEDIREIGAIAAEIFDELVFRERPDGRGREAGGVVRLLCEGAHAAGISPDRVQVVMDEPAAMDRALRTASDRDLVVLLPTRVDAVWEQVMAFSAERAARRGVPPIEEPAHV